MRTIDIDAETLTAANDEELARAVRKHYEQQGDPIDEERAKEIVQDEAYEAMDA